jgi:hypothetical protein
MTEDHLLSNVAAVPLAEQAAEEARLALAPHQPRREQLLTALAGVNVTDDEDLRRAVDKIALSRSLRESAVVAVQPITTPYREAWQSARGVEIQFVDPLHIKEQDAQRSIDAFRGRQRAAAATAANEQRAAEDRLRTQAGLESPAPAAPVKAADVKLPSVRSDYRGQVFDRKIIKVRIVDPRLLPDTILNAPGVTAALEVAVRQMAKLTRDIPGAEIEDDQASSVKVG